MQPEVIDQAPQPRPVRLSAFGQISQARRSEIIEGRNKRLAQCAGQLGQCVPTRLLLAVLDP